jgi:hypothetical protein
MSKAKLVLLLFPGLLLGGVIIGCRPEKRSIPATIDLGMGEVSMATALDEMLPEKSVRELGLKDRVPGTKIKHPGGAFVTYFEYDAKSSDVLAMLAHSPFSMYAIKSDTTARAISFYELELLRLRITEEEYQNAPDFWSAKADEFDAFECIKAPLMHTVLIHKKTKKILHRIEYQA